MSNQKATEDAPARGELSTTDQIMDLLLDALVERQRARRSGVDREYGSFPGSEGGGGREGFPLAGCDGWHKTCPCPPACFHEGGGQDSAAAPAGAAGERTETAGANPGISCSTGGQQATAKTQAW